VAVIACPPIADPDNRPYASFANEPLRQDDDGVITYDPSWPYEFVQVLSAYLDAGLSATADPDFVPGAGNSGHGRFCFDPTSVDQDFRPAPGAKADICAPPLLAPKTVTPADPGGTKSPPARKAAVSQPKTPETPETPPAGRGFTDPARSVSGERVGVYVTLRSVYAAYRFVGELVRAARQSGAAFDQPPAWLDGNQRLIKANLFFGRPANRMAEIAPAGPGQDCWGIARHGGKTYCVPADALRTKRAFALLHLLFVLNTKPNNTPTTPTVRVAQ